MQRIGKNLGKIPGGYWRYSSMEFLYRYTWAANSFLTVFLQSRGMSASQVGMINALCSTMGIIASPIWGMVSDKMRSVRKVFLLIIAVSAVLWSLIPPSFGVTVFGVSLGLFVIPIASFFSQPTNPLMDSWTVQNTNRRHLNYGAIRIWGSIGYAVMTIGLGIVMPYIGVEGTFYALGLWTIPLFILCSTTRDDAAAAKPLSAREMHFGRLFKNYYFITYLIFSVIMHLPVNTIFTFLPYLMKEINVPIELFGAVSGYRALLEIPFLLLMSRLRRRVSLPKLMLLSASIYLVECYCYSFVNGTWALILLQTMHGLANGLMIGCAANYVYSLAPDDLKATAQTVNGSVNSLSSILGSLLGGWLLDLMGVRNYYLLAGTMVLFSVLFFFGSLLLGRRLSRAPSPMDSVTG